MIIDNYAALLQLFSENILTILVVVTTGGFLWTYLIEKKNNSKLSKKYQKSVYEAQSKIFLSATQHLLSGERKQAIDDFLSALELNRETLDVYFTLGRLFRINGEIDKAIDLHQSLITREGIGEEARGKALEELALDFDKGGFIKEAIGTYLDILEINPDQVQILKKLCELFEKIENWDQAIKHRTILSRLSREDQSDAVSNLMIEKGKNYLKRGKIREAEECLKSALNQSPSVPCKIFEIQLNLKMNEIEDSRANFIEFLNLHPEYLSFLFHELEKNEGGKNTETEVTELKNFFLEIKDDVLIQGPSISLVKASIYEKSGNYKQAKKIYENFLQEFPNVKIDYCKVLIKLGQLDKAVGLFESILENVGKDLQSHFCSNCGFKTNDYFWKCPKCLKWQTFRMGRVEI